MTKTEEQASLPPMLQDFDTILRSKGIVPTNDLLDMLGGAVNHYEQAQKKEWGKEARIDENQSMLHVANAEIREGDKCYNHDRYVGQCAACRKRMMFYTVCQEWKKSIEERLAHLSSKDQADQGGEL